MICSSSACDIQYVYNIYKRQVFKPFSKDFFFKKIYEVICIINLQNTFFMGFTRGESCVTPRYEANFF